MATRRPAHHRRVKTPTVLQMETTECGAATLKSVLAYFGRHVPLEDLREDCRVSRDGSNALLMKRAAEKYGLTCRVMRATVEELAEHRPPLVLFWEMNHFVVFEGIAGGRAYLNDPASGPRTLDLESFRTSYTGVVFEFATGPDFRKGGRRPSMLKGVVARLKGAREAVAFVTLAGLAVMACELFSATLPLVFIDQVLIEARRGWVKPVLLAFAALIALRVLAGTLQQSMLRRLMLSLSVTQSARFFWHALRLPIEFYQRRFAGDLSQRVEANTDTADLLSGPIATTIVGLVVVVFYAVVIFQFDPALAAVGTLIGAVNLAVIVYVRRALSDQQLLLRHVRHKLYGVIMRAVQIIETIKAGAMESDTLVRLTGYQARVSNAHRVVGSISALLVALPPFLLLLTMSAVFWLGGGRVIEGALSIGALLATQTLMVNLQRPFADLVRFGTNFQLLQAHIARLDDVLKHEPDPFFAPGNAPGKDVPRRLSGRIVMKDVTFGYNRAAERPLIEGFCLEIAPAVAWRLVGGSGSGKSTIGRLACGLYAPWSGEITYDGYRIDQIPREVFTNDVAFVDDQAFLVAGSVRENLTLWDDTIGTDDIRRAAIDAAIHGDLLARRGGYETHVTEGARNLSGGQRQRLEIARALVRGPSLLVLDEATSALDTLTELRVDDHLRRRGCACLIIAHRLSTIRDCDEIIVMRQGQVAQRGTHDALMRDVDGPYYELYSLQEAVAEAGCATREPSAVEHVPVAGSHATNGSVELARNNREPATAALVGASVRSLVAVESLGTAIPCVAVAHTAANQPVSLEGASCLWRVISGQVDVFHVPVQPDGQAAPRRHVCRVDEGGALLAVEGSRREGQWGLLGVGVGEAELNGVAIEELERIGLDDQTRCEAAAWVDGWIDRITLALVPKAPSDLPLQLRETGRHELPSGRPISARGRVIWLRYDAGAAAMRFLGAYAVATNESGAWFPVSPKGWIDLDVAVEAELASTEELLERGELADALPRFHMVAHDMLDRARQVESAIRFGRLSSSELRDDALVGASLADLSRVAGREIPIDAPRQPDQLMFEACREVARAMGATIRPIEEAAPGDALRRISRASGLRTRNVRLAADWWRSDGGAMLGTLKEEARPVALVPGRSGGYVCVDPARGTRRAVDESVASVLAPSAVVFYRTLASAAPSVMDLVRFSLPFIRRDLKILVLTGVAGGLLGFVVPLVTSLAVDDALPRADRGQLSVLCMFLVAIALVIATFQAMQGVALVRIRGRLESDVVPAVWDRLLNLPARFFADYEAGDLALRGMGLARMVEVLSGTLFSSMIVMLFSLATLISLFFLSWRLALAASALLLICPMATALTLPSLWRELRGVSRAQGRISGLLLARFGGIVRLRLAGAERRAFARWAALYQDQLAHVSRFQRHAARLTILSDVWPLVTLVAVFATYSALSPSTLSVGEFLAFNVVLAQGLAAVVGLCNGIVPLLSGFEEFERCRPILNATPEASALHGEPITLQGAIRVANLSFRYESDAPFVLDSVNLQVHPGEFVAIVGASGSGKSTLLRLLLGFETPAQGSVAYDGQDLDSLDVQDVRRQVGVVLQNAQVIPGDVYANIVGLSSKLTRADAWQAAELAGLAEDIEQMPMGLHTVISEGGGGLSSGQRQRLLIARALAGRPRVLFFDEATSALDNRTQAHVCRSIHAQLRGVTRFAIAHRLSTIIEADRIYVMAAGKIVQSGTYQQLMHEPGVFRELARRQILN